MNGYVMVKKTQYRVIRRIYCAKNLKIMAMKSLDADFAA